MTQELPVLPLMLEPPSPLPPRSPGHASPPLSLEAELKAAQQALSRAEPLQALQPAMRALWIAERSGQFANECITRSLLARALSQSGDHLSAVVQFEIALITARRLKDVAVQAEILEGLGHAFLALEGFADASRSFRGAILAASRSQSWDVYGMAASELVRVLCRAGEHARRESRPVAARRYFRRALDTVIQYQSMIEQKSPATAQVVFAINIGYSQMHNRQFCLARSTLDAVLASKPIASMPRFRFAATILLGQIDVESGHYAAAIERLSLLAATMTRDGHNDLLHQVREWLAVAYTKLCDYAAALKQRELQIELLRALSRDVLAHRSQIAKLRREASEQREQARASQQSALHWREQASVDALTGLKSRRALEAELEKNERRPVLVTTALMLDLDHFKTINDRFGHGVGDRVLTSTGQMIVQVLSEARYLRAVKAYRYGGEEFALLGKKLSKLRARALAESIRSQVAAYPWPEIHAELAVTVSIGIGHGEFSPARALQVADAALYRAKRLGRNRVELV